MMNAEVMREAEQRRLAWRCRRGMLELDIVLQRFIAEQFGDLTLAEMQIFDEMLTLPDNEFWTLILSSDSTQQSPETQSVLVKLQTINMDYKREAM